MRLASTSAIPHHHQWQSEPPEGKLFWNKSFDERYGDEEDMASNAMFNSPDEIQRLQLLLRKDPDFANSSSWPSLVEWCSTCTSTRMVSLVLPTEECEVLEPVVEEEETEADCRVDEDKASCEATAPRDVSTQTPRQKLRRKGGRGSRTRRMLAFQLMLTVKRGLPMSRLLSEQVTNSRSSNAKEKSSKLQEESASPCLTPERVEVKVERKQEESMVPKVKEEKEEESCPTEKVSTGGFPIFTPRSFPTGANSPLSQPLPQQSSIPPFPASPLLLPLVQTPLGSQMPVANWVICGACQTWGTVFPICVI